MLPISNGWFKGNVLTKETILDGIRKTKELEEEYKRLTSDFEVK